MSSNNNPVPLFRKTALSAAVSGALAVTAVPIHAQVQLEEVVVTGIKGSLTRATEIKRDAVSFVDAISAEDIGKFPDLNVAESLQRITGVSIDREGGEGQQVTVRGLGPQFNTVLVNGRQIANDSGGREFNFDVLSSDQIIGASVFKSGVANLQEGGIGSTIVLRTARPFDNPGFYAVGSVEGTYETLSEEITPSFSGIISNTFADDKFGVLFSFTHQQRNVQINRIETVGWRPGQTISRARVDDAGNVVLTRARTEAEGDGERVVVPSNADGRAVDAMGNVIPRTPIRQGNLLVDADGNVLSRVADVQYTDAYIPRNWDQIVDEQDRTRINANLVLQFAPSEDLTITLDGTYNHFEVDSLVTDLASWFEPDRVGDGATIDPATNTLLTFSQDFNGFVSSGNPATDFVSHTRNSRDVTNTAIGINVDWQVNDNLAAVLDISRSDAENDRAGRDRFNVLGILNSYTFDGTGALPTVLHDGFSDGQVADANLLRLHYNERGNRPTDRDRITEFKLDFEYVSGSNTFESMRFGAYSQFRKKSQFQIFGSACPPCGYDVAAPNETLGVFEFTAENFFPGLIDTFYSYDGEAYLNYLDTINMGVTPTLQNNNYAIEEDIISGYVDFTFGFELGDMPLTVNLGARYSHTSIDSTGAQSFLKDIVPTSDQTLFQREFEDAVSISASSSYANVLPSVNLKLDITDDMVLRIARYDSLTRPTLSELSPAITFGEPRRQNLTAAGGNPELQPFQAENWDISYEWYYSDDSSAVVAFFNKEISSYIVTLVGDETFSLSDRTAADGFLCNLNDDSETDVDESTFCAAQSETEELSGAEEVFTVSRPRNGESARVAGFEVGVTHIFDNGFGVIANATFVDSDANLGNDTTQRFAVEGVGNSQNLVVFYEAANWQARVAYNNREAFLRRVDNGFNGEPVNTESFGQLDVSASYDINDNFQVFFEGINITEEELAQFGRFQNQTYNVEDNGSRYAIGIRGSFY